MRKGKNMNLVNSVLGFGIALLERIGAVMICTDRGFMVRQRRDSKRYTAAAINKASVWNNDFAFNQIFFSS